MVDGVQPGALTFQTQLFFLFFMSIIFSLGNLRHDDDDYIGTYPIQNANLSEVDPSRQNVVSQSDDGVMVAP